MRRPAKAPSRFVLRAQRLGVRGQRGESEGHGSTSLRRRRWTMVTPSGSWFSMSTKRTPKAGANSFRAVELAGVDGLGVGVVHPAQDDDEDGHLLVEVLCGDAVEGAVRAQWDEPASR